MAGCTATQSTENCLESIKKKSLLKKKGVRRSGVAQKKLIYVVYSLYVCFVTLSTE